MSFVTSYCRILINNISVIQIPSEHSRVVTNHHVSVDFNDNPGSGEAELFKATLLLKSSKVEKRDLVCVNLNLQCISTCTCMLWICFYADSIPVPIDHLKHV